MTDHLDVAHAHMRAASTLLPTPGVHTSTNAAHTSAQCHLVFSLLGLDRLWGRAMPCRWPFEPRWRNPRRSQGLLRTEKPLAEDPDRAWPCPTSPQVSIRGKLNGIEHECVRHASAGLYRITFTIGFQ